MLLIDCPYCGERPEPEFVYGGQAHVARPHDPAAHSLEEWSGYLYQRDNPRGRWYLKERPMRCTPFASSAEARVSPATPV